MKNVLVSLIVLVAVINASKTGKDANLYRRNLINFGSMVRCVAGVKSALVRFNNYGCHCGFGGEGKIVDEIDRCCYKHDRCYENLVKKDTCGSYEIYYRSYKHDCGVCSEKNEGCARALCECDSVAANCFKDNFKQYSWKNKFYSLRKGCKE